MTQRKCEVCAAPLVRHGTPKWRENWQDWTRRRFCGRACYARKRPLKARVTLGAYRMRARKHRGFTCERCGLWPVEAHHRDRRVANNARENIMTLCITCHQREHPRGQPW